MGDDYITLISNQKRNLLIHSNLNFMCHKSFLNGKYLKSKEYLLNPLFFQIISMNSYNSCGKENTHVLRLQLRLLVDIITVDKLRKNLLGIFKIVKRMRHRNIIYIDECFSDIHKLYPAGFLLVWAGLLLFSFERVLPKISKIFKTSTT